MNDMIDIVYQENQERTCISYKIEAEITRYPDIYARRVRCQRMPGVTVARLGAGCDWAGPGVFPLRLFQRRRRPSTLFHRIQTFSCPLDAFDPINTRLYRPSSGTRNKTVNCIG